jgi:predicted glycoside hydrolase/deacetylase ChbG (UPF0249 family)
MTCDPGADLVVAIEKKQLVICADDFGMNRAINAGILELARLRRINATSCLVEGPAFAEHAAALKKSGLKLGLHLNFTEAMGNEGVYFPLSALIARSYLHQLDTARIRAQIARQLDRFESVIGQRPEFVDGHQHIHQLPQIRETLLSELARRYEAPRPWLRYTYARSSSGLPLRARIKAQVVQRLGSYPLAQLARRRGFSLNTAFLGVYDFDGGAQAYRMLLAAWLKSAGNGDVLMCHPARQVVGSDLLGRQRRAEFDVLASDEVARWMDEYRIAL